MKEEGIVADAGGGGRGGYLDMLGLGEDAAAMADYYFLYPSPSSSSYVHSSAISTAPSAAVASPGCASYLQPPPPPAAYHNILSFGGNAFGFQYHGGAGGGGQAIPVAVPQKSSPTAECSSSISSMSSSPTATAVSAISISKPEASKKKGSRSSGQRKADAPAVAAAVPANKRPRVRREKLGERIQALQQLVSPFGKSDTASVLHEAFGYIRFLHGQVQALSSPYMPCLPSSARGPAAAVESSSDLRSRGLCLVPVACTEHVTSGVADVWSSSGQQQDEMLQLA